jgi:hypothetical protein
MPTEQDADLLDDLRPECDFRTPRIVDRGLEELLQRNNLRLQEEYQLEDIRWVSGLKETALESVCDTDRSSD